MPVTIRSKYGPLDIADAFALQSALSVHFPDDYWAFLQRYNVAKPDSNQYSEGEFTTTVTEFFGVGQSPNDDLVTENRRYDGRLPGNFLAIAGAGGGNLICLSLNDGSVYFWDHENEASEGEEADYSNVTKLASSFGEFIQRLEPRKKVIIDTKGEASVEFKLGAKEKFAKYLKNR